MNKCDLILRRGRLITFNTESEIVDIGIKDGLITAISPNLKESAAQELDLSEKLVSPPFVESHIHLDSVLTAGEPRWNESGTLFEGIKIWGDRKREITIEDVKNRALTMLKQQAAQGILFVRTHADVSEPQLIALQALLELRDEVKDWMTVQVVAFPQDGIYSDSQNEILLEKALEMGADAVGGIPHYELTRDSGVRSVQKIFELAEKYNRLIDIHCDEIDDEQSRFLEVVAESAIQTKIGSRVTASHTTAFGSYNNAYAYKLMGFLQRAQINFIANPLINITLQGRADTYPKRRGVTRVKELWQNGLNVSFGHDCVQDPWYSLGTGSMLDVAHMGAHICHMTGREEVDACYQMVTSNAAKTLNLEDKYGIEVGKPANAIVLNEDNFYNAIRTRNQPCYVISQGKIIASTKPAATNFSINGNCNQGS
ncbi:MAG: cytosine deaminase [Rivularia sp. (in: cyanobacteria)]